MAQRRGTITSLSGKVVAITGGARGIGFATAARLIAEGARVAIGDVDEAKLKEAAAELGIECAPRLDVTDPESFAAFLDRVESELGHLDVLVNNAGIMPIGPLHAEDDRATRRVVEINVLGVMYGTKLALNRMLPRRSGHVINISSLAGESYVPGGASYSATKHAVKAFTESARREYRRSGVAISQVMPIFVNTELIAGTHGVRGMRNAEPDEVAAAVVSLIERPRPKAWVTKQAGLLVTAQNYLPRRVTEAVARAMGAESTFLDGVDVETRRSYEERITSH